MTAPAPAGSAADPAADIWRQLDLTCRDWQATEQAAVRDLRPLLSDAQDNGDITGWWFIRKGPTWRVRLRSASPPFLDHAVRTLTEPRAGQVAVATRYEPETHAFGGPAGMHLAHELFQADSRYVLDRLAADPTTYRRELPVVLATRLLRAARLDFYEQGDCWAGLAQHRTASSGQQPTHDTIAAVQQLLAATEDTPASPLRAVPGWTTAMQDTGRGLTDLAATGHLTRGLRAILTHHLLFLFNRHGISGADQHRLATAAQQAVFGPPPPDHRQPHPDPTTLPTMTGPATDAVAERPDDATRLRNQLTDYIKGWGIFATPQVEAAFRTVPRHLFLPGIDLETAYGRKPVVTVRAADGTSLSSASSPTLVATMLEQLGPRPGQHVLEIGAATGINAALLSELVGPTGAVVTIELDPDLTSSARENLHRAGYRQVTVLCGDGALGHPAPAPYDGIIVTAEAWDIPPAWWDQLGTGGRIVVPLRLHGSGLTRAIAFDLTDPDHMTSTSAVVCGFVPLRGQAEHDEHHLRLTDDVILKIDTDDLPGHGDGSPDRDLGGVLAQPRQEHWTGIQVRHDEPAEHLDLWLLTTTTDRFGRLSVSSTARSLGHDPAMRWGGAALYDATTLAYLATRDLDEHTMELGVITHAAGTAELTSRTIDLLHRWSRVRPAQPAITAHRNRPAANDTAGTAGTAGTAAARVLRPHTTLTITW